MGNPKKKQKKRKFPDVLTRYRGKTGIGK